MPTLVTLDIFSGRPNPTWLLPDEESAGLQERLQAFREPGSRVPSGAFGGLGYRGFRVSHVPGGGQSHPEFHVHEGVMDLGLQQPRMLSNDRQLETWLLSTAGRAISEEVRAAAAAEIQKPPIDTAALMKLPPHAACPHCHAHDAPPYNPLKWNIPSVQPFNNCYNYANDHITNTFAQPGRAHGKMYTALSCPSAEPAAQADGLKPAPNFSHPLPPRHGWYVALVIWPGVDYHWYRQDNVGCWSHKPGGTPARNTDNSGHHITDPKTCNRGNYTVFCSYMITDRHVVIN